MPLWITEFALEYSPLLATETFFNQSIALFDNDTSIERYSYFGAFRAGASNIGWNATFLDGGGKLTDIGSWYLGGGMVADATTTTSSAPASTSSAKNSSAKGMGMRSIESISNALLLAVAVVVLMYQ